MATTVEQLYRNVLGREPDPGGLAYWSQQFGPTVDANELATFRSVAAVTEPGFSNALAPAPAPAAPATGTGEYWRSSDPRWSQFKPTGWGETEQAAQTYQSRVPPNLLYQAAADLGYTGPMYNPDLETGGYAPEFEAFWAQKRAEGYDLAVKHPDRGTVHSYFALVGPGNQPIKDYQVKEDALEVPKLLAKTAALAFGVPAAANALGLGTGVTGAGAGAGGAGAVDYSLATQAGGLTGTGAGLGTLPSTGVPGAIDYSLATQPVYGTGAGLAAGVAPTIGTGAGIALAPGVSPTLGAPSSFINQPANLPPTVSVPGAGAGAPSVAPSVPPALGQTAGAAASGLGQQIGQAAGQALGGAAKGLADSSIWGPLLSTLGSLYGGKEMAAATERAAQLQAEAANRAIGLQERMYQEGVARQAPFLQEGTAAFNRLAALSRGGPEAAQQFLTMEPGYGFRLGEGLKALERTQAARGNLLSGGAIKAGQRYAQDVASQEYSNAYNRLAQMAGIGPQAAGVANTLGQTFASNVGNLATQQGAASANALLGSAAARQSAYGDIGEAWGRYFAPQPMNYLAGGQYGR